METKLTIFTPTYNRAELLKNLYNSLVSQTNKNFVWLVVDDGSTDNTEQVIQIFQKENQIKIKYIKKENGGKFSAMDLAHSICETEFIACVDSDDYLLSQAVDNIYEDIEKCGGSQVVGIVQRRFTHDLKPFNESWLNQDAEIYFYELKDVFGYTSDTFLIFKTEVIKKFKFPQIIGEKFRTESILYNQFLFDYKILASNKMSYIGEYLEDGYTQGANKLLYKNPLSSLYGFKSDAYYFTKYNRKLIPTVFAWARYFAFRKVIKSKNYLKDEFRIKSPKKVLGCMLSPIFFFRYKKKQSAYLKSLKENK